MGTQTGRSLGTEADRALRVLEVPLYTAMGQDTARVKTFIRRRHTPTDTCCPWCLMGSSRERPRAGAMLGCPQVLLGPGPASAPSQPSPGA